MECEVICYRTKSDPNSERSQKQNFFGNYIKGLRKDNSGVAPLRDNGILVNNTQQKAEILNIQYHSVFTPENDSPIQATLNSNYPSMPEITVGHYYMFQDLAAYAC
jgi:hypothetical protein